MDSSASTFQCEECGKAFSTKFSMRRHAMAIHQGIRPFKCTCSKAFATQDQLHRHKLAKHNKDKQLRCEHGCVARFPSMNSLHYHYKTHHQVNTFVCPVPKCGLRFPSMELIKLHLKQPHHAREPDDTSVILKKEVNELALLKASMLAGLSAVASPQPTDSAASEPPGSPPTTE